MSLERQDVRAKLDPEMHRALTAICNADGCTIAEFIERLLVVEIERQVHRASLITAEIPGRGISGKGRE